MAKAKAKAREAEEANKAVAKARVARTTTIGNKDGPTNANPSNHAKTRRLYGNETYRNPNEANPHQVRRIAHHAEHGRQQENVLRATTVTIGINHIALSKRKALVSWAGNVSFYIAEKQWRLRHPRLRQKPRPRPSKLLKKKLRLRQKENSLRVLKPWLRQSERRRR